MTDIRWKQRFENYERAFILLREGLDNDLKDLSDLEKEGVVQRFEFTYELAWKLLKDYLEFSGMELIEKTPRKVIKQAFAASIINDGDTWMLMVEQRNLMSHTYSRSRFEKAVNLIDKSFYPVLDELYEFFNQSLVKNEIWSGTELLGFNGRSVW